MNRLQLKSILYREETKYALYFERNREIQAILKEHFPQIRWSQSQNAWILPFESKIKSQLFQVLRGKIWIDYSQLQQKQEAKSLAKPFHSLPALLEDQKAAIIRFKNYLSANRYSENTISTYSDALTIFLRFYAHKDISDITNLDVESFNNEYILKNKYSASFQNQVVNAIKLFFRVVEKKSISVELLERPRREHRLPNVLSKEEVKAIITAPTNLKHKMMLSLIYACGLRRSELLNLGLKDIHSARNLLVIRQSKGKKDRIVPIGNKLIESLREYFKQFKPKTWLFEGQIIGEKYSARSLELVLKKSCIIANINKPVTLHWLRHSYATHILESGTDLRFIQELLGHNSSRTTEIYTHVSQKSIQQIRSPFDDL
jgi:integrase/recombinase XerD